MLEVGPSQWISTSPPEEQQGKLFLAGLSPLVTSEHVDIAFGRFGEHLGVMLMDSYHPTVPSQVGIITFRRVLDAAEALRNLDGTIVNDMTIQVMWANGQLESIAKWQQEAQSAPQQLQPAPLQPLHAHYSHGPTASTSSIASFPQAGIVSSPLVTNGESGLPEIFVADFPTHMDETSLAAIFSAFSSVSGARIMRDKSSGKCRGYGFVSFFDAQDAERAIATMHGELVGGRALRVGRAEVKPPVSTAPKATKGNARSMGLPPTAGIASGAPLSYETIRLASDPSNTTMYLGELPLTITEDKLILLVAEFGRVIQIRIQRPSPTPDGIYPNPYAFVKLDTHDGCTKAIQAAGGHFIDGQRIKSGWSKDKERAEGAADAGSRRNGGPSTSHGPGQPHQKQPHQRPQHQPQPPQPYQPQLYQPAFYQAPPASQQHFQMPLQHPQHQPPHLPVYEVAAVPLSDAYGALLPTLVPVGFSPAFHASAVPPHAVPVPVMPPHFQQYQSPPQ